MTNSVSEKKENSVRLARLAAVQALYQMALTDAKVADAIRHFRENPETYLNDVEGAGDDLAIDQGLFADIVQGVTDQSADIDGMITGAMTSASQAERLEPLLRAILRAGLFELRNHASMSSGIIISDYVDVTHAFFDAKEPGLVNAVLDRVGKSLRG